MIKLDIVLQGPLRTETQEVVKILYDLEFVNNIIISSYISESEKLPDCDIFIDNDLIIPAGVGNRNLHINTSINGLKKVDTFFSIKMRTDQIISKESMNLMYNYWLVNDRPLNRIKQKNKPNGRIYVCGLYRYFPYHPRDHIFWGFTEDLIKLFDIPFDTNMNHDYTKNVRAETYIGQYYYAKFNPKIYSQILQYNDYLVDGAPKHSDAMKLDWELREDLFKVFPKIEFSWPKHGLKSYHYNVGESLSEYWAE